MKIILNPIASDKTTEVSVKALVVTVDGQEIDLSVIPIGGQAEAEENSPFIGVVTRECCTINYKYNMVLAEPHQSANWDDYTFEVTDGVVPCPIKWLSDNITENIKPLEPTDDVLSEKVSIEKTDDSLPFSLTDEEVLALQSGLILLKDIPLMREQKALEEERLSKIEEQELENV